MSGFVKTVSFKKQNLNFRLKLRVEAPAALQSLGLRIGPDFCPQLQGQNPALGPKPLYSKPPLQQNLSIDMKPNPA